MTDDLTERVRAFIEHAADHPHSLIFRRGKTLRVADLRDLLARLEEAKAERVALQKLSAAADEINGVIDRQIYDERRRENPDPQPGDVFPVTLTWAEIHSMDRAICEAQRLLAAAAP